MYVQKCVSNITYIMLLGFGISYLNMMSISIENDMCVLSQ